MPPSSLPSSTVFILVPGAYCLASLYRKTTDRLRTLGYEAIESDHPTITDTDNVNKAFSDDAEHVRRTASDLLDQGKNVILVGNSYGGFVLAEAAKGLSVRERQAAGKTGGVLKNLVCFGSLLPSVGVTCNELTSGIVDVNNEREKAILDPPPPAIGAAMIMSDLSLEDQLLGSGVSAYGCNCF